MQCQEEFWFLGANGRRRQQKDVVLEVPQDGEREWHAKIRNKLHGFNAKVGKT